MSISSTSSSSSTYNDTWGNEWMFSKQTQQAESKSVSSNIQSTESSIHSYHAYIEQLETDAGMKQ